MSSDIPAIVKFRQEINQTIDKCLEDIRANKDEVNDDKRLLTVTLTYYNRMKSVYNCHQSDDDDDDDDKIISDVSNDSDDDDSTDYSRVVRNRVWANPSNVIQNSALINDENTIRRNLLSLDYGFGENNNILDDDDDLYAGIALNDTSVDPVNYSASDLTNNASDDNNTNIIDNSSGKDIEEVEDDEEDEHANHVLNNIRKTLLTFVPESDIEILIDDATIDYNDPIIDIEQINKVNDEIAGLILEGSCDNKTVSSISEEVDLSVTADVDPQDKGLNGCETSGQLEYI